MSCELLALLFGNGDRVVENSDLLVVAPGDDHGVAGAEADAVDVTIGDVLVDLLHREPELTRPRGPPAVFKKVSAGGGSHWASPRAYKLQLIGLGDHRHHVRVLAPVDA